MSSFVFQTTGIDGLRLISSLFYGDQRGYLSKTFEREIFAENGISLHVAEELVSCSARNTLRGLHFQRRYSQDKLIRVLSGEIYDVAVDLRPDSKTFGKWQGFVLSSANRKMLYIPKDFAHGFLARQDNTVVYYLCGDRYDPESEGGILWNDPDLGIDWPFDPEELPLLSEKDRNQQTFREFRQSLLSETGGNNIG